MVSYKTKRIWHKWPGILFLLPSLIISITAVLLAFNGILKLDRIILNPPGNSSGSANFEIKSMVINSSGLFTGTKQGLYIFRGDDTIAVAELAGFDIRSMTTDGDTVWIASKQGLWKHDGHRVTNLLKEDVFGVSRLPERQLLVSLGKKGYKVIDFQGNVIRESLHLPANLEDKLTRISTTQAYTLHKLIVDLHTGEALVGRTLKSWYIALTGIQMLILTVTGFWLLFKKKRQKKYNTISV